MNPTQVDFADYREQDGAKIPVRVDDRASVRTFHDESRFGAAEYAASILQNSRNRRRSATAARSVPLTSRVP